MSISPYITELEEHVDDSREIRGKVRTYENTLLELGYSTASAKVHAEAYQRGLTLQNSVIRSRIKKKKRTCKNKDIVPCKPQTKKSVKVIKTSNVHGNEKTLQLKPDNENHVAMDVVDSVKVKVEKFESLAKKPKTGEVMSPVGMVKTKTVKEMKNGLAFIKANAVIDSKEESVVAKPYGAFESKGCIGNKPRTELESNYPIVFKYETKDSSPNPNPMN